MLDPYVPGPSEVFYPLCDAHSPSNVEKDIPAHKLTWEELVAQESIMPSLAFCAQT